MRGCSRYVRDNVAARAHQERVWRFTGCGENQRATAEQGAKKNLQTAVTPNVVKGCPHDRTGKTSRPFDCAGQSRECVHHHLWYARGTRREENPLGVVRWCALDQHAAYAPLAAHDG